MGNLAELAELSSEHLMADAGPALRAALKRHLTETGESATGKFNSFIGSSV
ncbi:hypothetical protein [Nocardia acidivorans]|uniref:hypothetical protein n=1 Tax=Nocardia acidivorans TaxID=404580 RepID=UPI0012FAA680|nr:hypothetical protein [Nocardia acidivorans]